MTLQDAFDKVQKLGLNNDQYGEVIQIICDWGNEVRTKTTNDAIKIMKTNYEKKNQ